MFPSKLTALVVALVVGAVFTSAASGSARGQDECNVEDLEAPCPLADGQRFQGAISQQGGRNYFWFGVPVSDMHLRVELLDLPADYDLYIFSDQSPDPTRPFAQSTNLDLDNELIDAQLTLPGTYLLEVVSDPSLPFDPEQPYTLTFALIPPPTPTPTPEPTRTPTPTPEPVRVAVPPVVHHSGNAAALEVQAAGLLPRLHSVDRFSPAGAGAVAAQDPQAGTIVSPDSPVDLFVATGNVQIPPVAGLSEQDAVKLLQEAGFKVETRRAASATVPAGQAISVTPSAGEVLPSGSEIEVLISRGT
ncbi:MAG TPA: PASTA domain-containing protein [Chloroflexota bacterium]